MKFLYSTFFFAVAAKAEGGEGKNEPVPSPPRRLTNNCVIGGYSNECDGGGGCVTGGTSTKFCGDDTKFCTSDHNCCSGVIHDWKVAGCCGNPDFSSNFLMKTNSNIGTGNDKVWTYGAHGCCGAGNGNGQGGYWHDWSTTGCCNNELWTYGVEGCCGAEGDANTTTGSLDGVKYAVSEEGCCGGEVYNITDTGCCGDSTIFPSETEGCCGGVTYVLADEDCCGNEEAGDIYDDEDNEGCCDGVFFDTDLNQDCCGNVTVYSTNTTEGCCGGKVFDSDESYCCGDGADGTVYPKEECPTTAPTCTPEPTPSPVQTTPSPVQTTPSPVQTPPAPTKPTPSLPTPKPATEPYGTKAPKQTKGGEGAKPNASSAKASKGQW